MLISFFYKLYVILQPNIRQHSIIGTYILILYINYLLMQTYSKYTLYYIVYA